MEENLLSIVPDYKLYKDSTIRIGTFIGGPLVAGYLAAENFKKLGQSDKAKNAWIISIITTLIILSGIFLIPENVKIPNYIIPLIYTWVAYFLVNRYQGDAIKEHIEKGGLTYSGWRAVWIGLIGLVVLCAIILIAILLINKDLLQ
jgi:hypothetical protein